MAGKRDWGRVRQLGSGRWQARYPGPDGQLRPAPDTFERKVDATQWLADKRSEINRDEWVNPDKGKVLFGDFAAAWLAERDLAETTMERYEGILRNHVRPILGDKALSEIKEGTVRQWRKSLLNNGVGAPSVAKAYRMVHAMFATAVDDRNIARNPCRIKGAGDDKTAERPVLEIDQVFMIAKSIQPRYEALVLFAAFTSLRFGELAALRRRDIDLNKREVYVRRSQAELRQGRRIIKDPKSEAGKRTVSIPKVIMSEVREHLDRFAQPGRDGLVFIGPQGGVLQRRNFRRLWTKAVTAAGLEEDDVHFHDLRHTGNNMAAETGASTKELMARMGHSSQRAALIYQHASRRRDQEIADAISRNVKKARKKAKKKQAAPKGHARGTATDGVE
jgi:integrase